MRIAKFLLPILILAMGIGTYQYFKSSRGKPEPRGQAVRVPVVGVQVIDKQRIFPGLTLFGQIEAPNNSVLSAGISADVLEVYVLEGSAVNQGDPLVRLDDADTALDILQRKAEIAEIEAQIESDHNRHASDKSSLEREKALLSLIKKAVVRAATMVRSSAGTEAALDTALQQEQQQLLAITQRQQSIDDFSSRQKQFQARLEKARAALSRSLRDQGRTEVNAPYTGRVIKVMVSRGDRINPGNPLVQLYDDSQLEVRAQVPGRYVPRLQDVIDNRKILHATLVESGRSVKLKLDRLSASIAQGQGGVDAFFRTVEGALPVLGKTVQINMELPAIDQAVALSPDSLYGSDRVYRIEEGVLRALTVSRLGQRIDDNGYQQIIVDGSPFSTGDRVMNSRLPQAIDGLKVDTRE